MTTEVLALHPMCFTTDFWGKFLLSQVCLAIFCWGSLSFYLYTYANWGSPTYQRSYCCPLGCICITPGVPLPLTVVADHHLRCFTSPHSGEFVLFHVSYCCSLAWFCFVPDVLLLLTCVAFSHPGVSLLLILWLCIFSASHCLSLKWLQYF